MDRLRSNEDLRHGITDEIEKKQAEFQQRSKAFLEGNGKDLTIDDVLLPLKEKRSAEVELASTIWQSRRADVILMAATGEMYRRVGMEMENGNGSLAQLPIVENEQR